MTGGVWWKLLSFSTTGGLAHCDRTWDGSAYAESLAKAAFFVFLLHNSDFGRSGRCVPRGSTRFGSSQNPGCGAVRSDADAR
jgi:hypothetical protein